MPKKYKKYPVQYHKQPTIDLRESHWRIDQGWEDIGQQINQAVHDLSGKRKVVVIETYQGVLHEEILPALRERLSANYYIHTADYMHAPEYIRRMVYADVTDDRIFGYLTRLNMQDFFAPAKLIQLEKEINRHHSGVWVIYGPGASLCYPTADILIYADLARWEIQQRMRRHEVDNLGVQNRHTADWMLLYKQAFFVDWRVCDRLKKKLFNHIDFLLDTNQPGHPKLISGEAIREGLQQTVSQPFSVVPFFDPGPWGGQWMKEVCELDPSAPNYAWCFNAVPEENSLLLQFKNGLIEIPAINAVFFHPMELLGEAVYARFGDEFPIRFDFLDTMDGGNLSLQVHPLTEYIQEKFGWHYTQDESYYFMDTGEEAIVYLGLKEGVDSVAMMEDLQKAQAGEIHFEAEKYVQTWPVKKHDHILIPAGTVHCSGKNSMVLEISATPYIFTFKLWDWGRLGLDDRPRPINLEHGFNVIQWDRTATWTAKNLVNQVELVEESAGCREERTGLHASEFIETRRHWFDRIVMHNTGGGVQVLCLVEGAQVVIESPQEQFKPFILHYAEVVIIPARIDTYSIRPCGLSAGQMCCTIKGYVRA